MVRGKELSPQLRSRICELYSLGYKPKKIYEIHRDIPINTIKTTVRREKLRKDNVSRPRSGAPRKLTEADRDHIYDLIIHENPHIRTKDLLAAVDFKVKDRVIRMLTRDLGRRK